MRKVSLIFLFGVFFLGFIVSELAGDVVGTTNIYIVNKTEEKIVVKQPKQIEFVKRSNKDGRGDRTKEDFVGESQIIIEPGKTKKIVPLGRDQCLHTSGQLVDTLRFGKAELIRTSILLEIEGYGWHLFESEWSAKNKGSSSRFSYSGEKIRGTNIPYQRVYESGATLKVRPKFKLPYWDVEMVFLNKKSAKKSWYNLFKGKK